MGRLNLPEKSTTMFHLLLLLPSTSSLPTSTTSPNNDCGHKLDCEEQGDGWWPDPYNCRKFWHCERGVGHHMACEDDMLFDLRYTGCNFASQTDCGERPICGPCDKECVTQPPPTTPVSFPVFNFAIS